jgi:hypothetical protein
MGAETKSGACTPNFACRPHSFSHLIENIVALAEDAGVGDPTSLSVADIMAVIGRRSYGPLLLALGLFSISPATLLPGMTSAAALVTLAVSLQLAFGSSHPWLPRMLLRLRVARTTIRAAANDGLRKWTRRLDRVLQPRLVFLSEPPFANAAGLLCALAAFATFPLSFVPLAPFVPGLAITALGLGLFARDGFLLVFSGVLIVAAVGAALAAALSL